MAAEPGATGLTYEDLRRFPDDGLRREIIDGGLFVTPAPGGRHQDVVLELAARLLAWSKEHGGKVYVAPRDVFLSDRDIVGPDVVFIRADHLERAEERFVRGAPDLVVEISSPSTKARDRGLKRDLYERYGMPEYWFVDLDEDRVEVHRLQGAAYGPPRLLGRGEALESPQVPGLSIPVADILGPPAT